MMPTVRATTAARSTATGTDLRRTVGRRIGGPCMAAAPMRPIFWLAFGLRFASNERPTRL
jgi:hypothetical protein